MCYFYFLFCVIINVALRVPSGRFWANNFFRESYIVATRGSWTADTHLASAKNIFRGNFAKLIKDPELVEGFFILAYFYRLVDRLSIFELRY